MRNFKIKNSYDLCGTPNKWAASVVKNPYIQEREQRETSVFAKWKRAKQFKKKIFFLVLQRQWRERTQWKARMTQ